MNKTIKFPTAPAGFRIEHYCSCGMGCSPEGLNTEDRCEILGSSYTGPDAHIIDSSGCQLNSYWTAKDGISFRLSNYGYNDADEYVERAWTREELEHVPAMIERVLGMIDQANTDHYLTSHPDLLPSIETVNDLARVAKEHGLNPSAVCQAWMNTMGGAAEAGK